MFSLSNKNSRTGKSRNTKNRIAQYNLINEKPKTTMLHGWFPNFNDMLIASKIAERKTVHWIPLVLPLFAVDATVSEINK